MDTLDRNSSLGMTAYLYCGLINTGLNLYPPAFFIPVQAVFFALFTIICGGIFFYEFQFNVLQSIMPLDAF